MSENVGTYEWINVTTGTAAQTRPIFLLFRVTTNYLKFRQNCHTTNRLYVREAVVVAADPDKKLEGKK